MNRWNTALRNAFASVRAIVRQPWLVLLSTLLDVAFLFVYGFLTQPIRDVLTIDFTNLASVLGQALQQAGQRYETPSIFSLLFAPDASPYFWGTVFWMVVWGLIAYVLWALVQGGVWRIAAGTAGEKRGAGTYLWEFGVLNAWWGLIFVVAKSAVDVLDLRSALVQSITRVAGWVVPAWARFAFLCIFAFFVLLSYALLSGHRGVNAFKRAFGVERILAFIPSAAVLAVAFVAVYAIARFILNPLVAANEALGLILTIVVLGPLAFACRVFVSRSLQGDDRVR
jgi:hypothetical protein